MAKIYGAAGEHVGEQSVIAFRKMLLVYIFMIGVLCFAEGVLLTAILTHPLSLQWTLPALLVAGGIFWAVSRVENRAASFETSRLSYRMGFLGEKEVALELDRLSDEFVVFHNVNTPLGNFDHIVIGPTGFLAIETKNWTGHIAASESGELTRNGARPSQPYVGQLLARVMHLREQIVALSRDRELRIRAVMVFPKASLEAQYGKTREVHCLRVSKLYDYVVDGDRKLNKEKIELFARSMHAVASMDRDFKPATENT